MPDRAPSSSPAASPEVASTFGPLSSARREVAIVAAFLSVLVAIAFGGSLGGGFVYDDHHQIVENPQIHTPGGLWRAVSTDVYAYMKADGTAGTNYWRPVYMLWLASMSRLWGVEDAALWHAASLLWHVLAGIAGYGLLRVLRVRPVAAGCIALLFAIHPTRVEAVAWISSAHDPICAAALFAALAAVIAARRFPEHRRRLAVAAVIGYAVALGTKEVAVLFPPVVAAALWLAGPPGENPVPVPGPDRSTRTRWIRSDRIRDVLAGTLPFAILAAAYVLLRYLVLGYLTVRNPWATDLPTTLLSIPRLVVFYLGQVVWPVDLGPLYPLRAVEPGTASATTLGPALALLAALGLAAIWLARRDGRIALGTALALATLAPVLNVGAFHPERIVQDRYLYLPFFGLMTAVVLSIDVVADRLAGWGPGRRDRLLAAVTAAVGLPLVAVTMDYGSVWSSDLALWERGVATDPGSAFAWSQRGTFLMQAGRLAEARDAAGRAMAIQPRLDALLLRADIAVREARWPEAEADLRQAIAAFPDRVEAYERLAVVLQNSGRLDDGIAVLADARERLPRARCRLTTPLAVLLYQAGERDRAESEIESVRALAAGERNAACSAALFRLGQLYRDTGRETEARTAFAEFLSLTDGFHDPETRDLRALAVEWIGP